MSKAKTRADEQELPPEGDTSVGAVAGRLRYLQKRCTHGRWGLDNPVKLAQCTTAQWRAYASGKTLIPKRNAWFLAQRSRDYFVISINEWWPSEWIYTGMYTEWEVPSPVPRLGSDLSGFASRMREAIDSHGLSLSDIDEMDGHFLFVRSADIRAFAAGLDEPSQTQLESLVDILEVDGEWLYGQPAAPSKPASPGWPRWFKPHLTEGADVYYSRGVAQRITAACQAGGVKATDMRRVVGNEPESDIGRLTALAILCGVPLESLIYSAGELAILRRRIDRFKRRLGVPSPSKRRKSAA
jgi:hypothetical protein